MAYHCGYISEKNKKEWEELVQEHSAGGFHQSFYWAKFKQADGWDTYKIGIFDAKNKLIGGTVIFQFHFHSTETNFLYIPEGPILDYENEEELNKQWKVLEIAIHSIADVGTKAKTTHIRIEPRLNACPKWFLSKFTKAPLNLQPKYTQTVDLKPSESEILAQMKQKGRYNIRLAEKKGVKITKIENIQRKDRQEFYKIYKQTFERNKFEGKQKDLFEHLMTACKPISSLFFAEHEDKRIATAYVFYYGDRATYLYGASSNENRELMAPYLLHWEIMRDAKKKSYKTYDFWGIAPKKSKEHNWQGLTNFKKKFGGKEVALMGAYDHIIQKDLYEVFLQKHEL